MSETDVPYTLHLGDCLDVMRSMADASVDAIVTDPPYELGFMGKSWDASGIAYSVAMWREALRVLKPGGHLLAFSGARTYHRMACAIEDAGFEIRDQIMWVYFTGFPKSLNVSKAIDKAAGAERPVIGRYTEGRRATPKQDVRGGALHAGEQRATIDLSAITAPATDAARQWEGWGTALKPSHEPICVARKPLTGTVSANVLAHGTGALNIDACRVPTNDKLGGGDEKAETSAAFTNEGWRRPWMSDPTALEAQAATVRANVQKAEALGRWPANLIHDGSPEVVALFPANAGAAAPVHKRNGDKFRNSYGAFAGNIDEAGSTFHGDSGSAARFFYCPKATRKDRNEGGENTHPTVKPVDLMAYLARLITPPGGTVYDPFMGSGSTGKACMREGFKFVGSELTPDYLDIAHARITHEYLRVREASENQSPVPQLDLFAVPNQEHPTR